MPKPTTQPSPAAPVVRTAEGLRDALFDVLDGLRRQIVTPQQAMAAAKLASQIVNLVRVEIDFQSHAECLRISGVDHGSLGVLKLGRSDEVAPAE